jgi:hypothetical protein
MKEAERKGKIPLRRRVNRPKTGSEEQAEPG